MCEVSACVRVCMPSSCYKSSFSRRCVCVCVPACVCLLIAQMNVKKVCGATGALVAFLNLSAY